MKITKLLIGVVGALTLSAVSCTQTTPHTASQPTVSKQFTGQEIAFVQCVQQAGVVVVAGDQATVDMGWAVIYALQHGYRPEQIYAQMMDRNSISMFQAQKIGACALEYLPVPGSQPSPGGLYHPGTSGPTL